MMKNMLAPLEDFILHCFQNCIILLVNVQHFWNRNLNDGMYLHYHCCFWNCGNFLDSFLGNSTILVASFFQSIVWHHCISNYHIIRIKCCLNCNRFTHIDHFFSGITLCNQFLFCNYVFLFTSIMSLWLLQCFFHSSLTLFAFQCCNHSQYCF